VAAGAAAMQCATPMSIRTRTRGFGWACPVHGVVATADLVAAQRTAAETPEAA
jgi:hypothetical protein